MYVIPFIFVEIKKMLISQQFQFNFQFKNVLFRLFLSRRETFIMNNERGPIYNFNSLPRSVFLNDKFNYYFS